MKDLFVPKPIGYDFRRHNVLCVPKVKTTTYGIKSERFSGPKMWNSLSNEIKSLKNSNQFKAVMKDGISITIAPAMLAANNLHNAISTLLNVSVY